MSKKKLLIFHPALAPYRVDQFNMLSQIFELEVVFIFDNVWNHKFDQEKLLAACTFKYSYLLFGPFYKGRVFRFGMLRKINKNKPDIVFGYEFSFITLYIVLLRRLGFIKQKIGSMIDDNIEICIKVQSKTRELARKLLVNRLDYAIVLSPAVSQFYQEKFSLKNDQVIVSPILQNPDRIRKNHETLEGIATGYIDKYKLAGKKVLLFVGRLIPEKGLNNFINAVYPLLLQHSEVVMVIVGEGVEKDIIGLTIQKNDLTSKILLPGRFEGEAVNAWYLCASGLILPSIFEPFGAVVNEALIFGCKVFCSTYAGSSYLINQNNGIVFDPRSEEDTKTKLNEFIGGIDAVNDPSLATKKPLMKDEQQNLVNEWKKISAA